MLIDIHAFDRLRGQKPVHIQPALENLIEASKTATVDLADLRVVFDWVQYRQNFRPPVSARQIMPSALQTALARGKNPMGANSYELAVDMRRLGLASREAFARALTVGGDIGRQYLEPWQPESASCIWDFNSLYWNALGLWEQATGREYEQALPGGETDARNTAAAQDLVLDLFRVWDDLDSRRALPQDLHVLELGVGNGNQAKVWLDEFLRLDRERGSDYYRRLHYLMGDYSAHVLDRARESVQDHASRVSTLVLDARTPTETLQFLRGKAFLIYISNVYDNLPTDEIVRIGGHIFLVQVRAYVSGPNTARIAEAFGIEASELSSLTTQLLKLGPELLSQTRPQLTTKTEAGETVSGPLAVVALWRAIWDSVRLEERYLPIEGIDVYEVAPGIGGELIRPIVEANGDVRMQVSNGAAASFVDSLPLLHPFGSLQCHDIFVTDVNQYRTSFRGPGKYDGSVVNWVNGPILTAIANRRGYEARIGSFQHRTGTNISTLSARVRE